MNHLHSVGALALTSDGTEIISADVTGRVRRWERLSGEALLEPLAAHDRSIWTVLLTQDDNEFITSGSDGIVRRWQRGNGRPIAEPFAVHTDWIRSIALTSDGRELLTAAQDGTIRRWNLTSGSSLGGPITGHKGAVWAISLTPDGSEIITAGQDGTIRRWDPSSGSPLADPITGHPGAISDLALSVEGSEIITTGRDALIRRWDRHTGRPIGEPFTGHTAAIRALALTSDDTEIVTGASDGTVRRWDRATGRPIGQPLSTGQGSVWALALTQDDTEIITAGWDGSIRRWDRLSGVAPMPSAGTTRPVTDTVLTAGPNPSTFGQPVTLIATVTGPGDAPPTGEVVCTDEEVGDGTRTLGSAQITAGSGSLSATDIPVGTHFITGSYGGDSSFRPSSGVVAHRVEQVGTTTDPLLMAGHFLTQSRTRAAGQPPEAVAAARAAVEILHGVQPPADATEESLRLLAEALHTLVQRLLSAGRPGQVAQPAQEAMQVYRRAASVSTGESVTQLAHSVLRLSGEVSGVFLMAEAITAAQTAVNMLHEIPPPPGHEAAYFSALATALHDLVVRLTVAGRLDEVPQTAQEATQAYRRAAGVSTGERVTEIANILLTLSSRVSAIALPTEATSAAQAAVDVLRGLQPPAGHEAAYFSLLAKALRALAQGLIQGGRPEEAAQRAQEATQAEETAASLR